MIICALTKTKPRAFEDLWSPVFWFSLASAKRQNLESEQVGKWRNCLIFIMFYIYVLTWKTSRFNLLVSYKYIKNRNSFATDAIRFSLPCNCMHPKTNSSWEPGNCCCCCCCWGCRNEMALILLPYVPRSILIIYTIDGHPSNIRIYVILVTCNGYMQ